jgi:hypothetical protein
MADEVRKVEVGFDGGQVLSLRLTEKALGSLRDALGGTGWHRVETDEAQVDVDLAKVAFLRAVGDPHKVGF